MAKTKRTKLKQAPALRPDAVPEGYEPFLRGLKDRIRNAQIRAALAVNRELVLLYWQLGRDVLGRQEEQGWGAKVIDRLAADLRRAFPGMAGFSPRNLKYMRAFAEAWPEEPIVQQVAAQIPWFHHCVLLDKVKRARGSGTNLGAPNGHRAGNPGESRPGEVSGMWAEEKLRAGQVLGMRTEGPPILRPLQPTEVGTGRARGARAKGVFRVADRPAPGASFPAWTMRRATRSDEEPVTGGRRRP